MEDGSVDVGILGQKVKLPLRFISSTDKDSVNDLLKRMGQRLGSMLQAANLPEQRIVLRTLFTKRDGTQFSVETPLGTSENARQTLSNVTLWLLVPEEAQHAQIKHISMCVQVSIRSTSSSRILGSRLQRGHKPLRCILLFSCRSLAHPRVFKRSGRHPRRGIQQVSCSQHSKLGELFLGSL